MLSQTLGCLSQLESSYSTWTPSPTSGDRRPEWTGQDPNKLSCQVGVRAGTAPGVGPTTRHTRKSSPQGTAGAWSRVPVGPCLSLTFPSSSSVSRWGLDCNSGARGLSLSLTSPGHGKTHERGRLTPSRTQNLSPGTPTPGSKEREVTGMRLGRVQC